MYHDVRYLNYDKNKLNIPPHSLEAEQAILGILMIDKSSWQYVFDKLIESDFYRNDHRIIYFIIIKLAIDNQPVDLITVSEYLDLRNELFNVGGIDYLAYLINNIPNIHNISVYIEIVKEKSFLRNFIDIGMSIVQFGFNTNCRSVLELTNLAEQKILNISDRYNNNNKDGPLSISKILKNTLSRIEFLYNSNTFLIGLSSGFKELDKITSGLQSSDLIIIAARPSMGKTTLALNIAKNIAIDNENSVVLIFSMEMPADQLSMKLLSSFGNIELQKIRTGKLYGDDWNKLSSNIDLMSTKKLFIDDDSCLSPMDIKIKAKKISKKSGKISLIVVDYLQLMKIPGFKEHRSSEISEISRSLKSLARELDVPIIVLSQLNRSLEQRNDKRPIMSDLRDSGSIEQDADTILFIYRDEVYNKDSYDVGLAEIIISKQRNGPIGMFKLNFFGKYSKFENFLYM